MDLSRTSKFIMKHGNQDSVELISVNFCFKNTEVFSCRCKFSNETICVIIIRSFSYEFQHLNHPFFHIII